MLHSANYREISSELVHIETHGDGELVHIETHGDGELVHIETHRNIANVGFAMIRREWG
jgi:hypothetical protein